MPFSIPKCKGQFFCHHMNAVLFGRNVQGFIVEDGKIVFKGTHRTPGKPIHYCPFCGVKIPGAQRRADRIKGTNIAETWVKRITK